MKIRHRFAVGSSAAAIGALVVGGCSGSPTVTPAIVLNTPPTIESVVIGARAEADEPIQVSATVKDAETPLAQLTYTWSASPQTGTFSGNAFSGSQALIMWRPPKGQTSPDLYTITLNVTEAYTSAGQAKQNIVSSSATVHYNDSTQETTSIGSQFIADFGTFAVSPAQCVRNFSDNCAGKKAEQSDIEGNRANFRILSSSFTPTVITFNSGRTAGSVEGPCTFVDIPKSGENAGKTESVSGTCVLTTVYENFRWFLCDSFFRPPFNTTLLSLKGRVSGRLLPE